MEAPAKAFREQPDGDMPTRSRICFVCTGNTCRSPMAAAVANAQWGQELTAISRGLYANEGEPITPLAIQALETAGIKPCPQNDYHTHTARNLSTADVQDCDLLVAVSAGHAMQMLLQFPQAAHKITCLPTPIDDPWGQGIEVYQRCLESIIRGVNELLAKGEGRP